MPKKQLDRSAFCGECNFQGILNPANDRVIYPVLLENIPLGFQLLHWSPVSLLSNPWERAIHEWLNCFLSLVCLVYGVFTLTDAT